MKKMIGTLKEITRAEDTFSERHEIDSE